MSDITLSNWKEHANKRYKSWKEYSQKYRRVIDANKKLSEAEQKWVNDNLQPVIDFMGEFELWSEFENLKDLDAQVSKSKMSENKYGARFSGTHWTARRPGDIKVFDPYTHYQYMGSNQFCQTYALMYVSGHLPPPNMANTRLSDKFERFYDYSLAALKFIKFYILELKKVKKLRGYTVYFNEILEMVEELLKYPNATLNCITLNKEIK